MKDYIPVSTKFITGFIDPLPFDVYLERSPGKFTQIYKKYSNHDDIQIDRYKLKNLNQFFIKRDEKDFFETFLVHLNDPEKYSKEMIFEVLKTGLEFNYEYMDLENDDLKTNLELASHNVKSSIYLLENDVQLAIAIFKALSSYSKLLRHSYMVSLFSIALAKNVGMTTNRVLQIIGLGAFLHDIGQTRLDPDLFMKNNLLPKEWDEIKDHPQLGLKILDYNKCISTEVRCIILQHHEQHNGRGYPNRLTGPQIYPPAKVVAIADGFCSLISKTSYRDTDKTPAEALEILHDDLGHYDPEYLKVFANMILKKGLY